MRVMQKFRRDPSFQQLLGAVAPLYERNDPAHDLAHALRVTSIAEKIAAEEGGDLRVILPGALCHDLGRWEAPSHSDANGAFIASLLEGQGYDAEATRKIVRVVMRHSLRGPTPPETLDEKIVFDADKLESLGAIGIGRCFAVSGSLDQELFASQASAVTAQSMLTDHLSRSYDRLHTASARRLGKTRYAFLMNYIDQLESELAVVGVGPR